MNEIEFYENLIEYFESSALYGESNPNGADSYNCPSCYAYENIKGYCSPTTGIYVVKHEDDCKLMELYQFAVDKLEEINQGEQKWIKFSIF